MSLFFNGNTQQTTDADQEQDRSTRNKTNPEVVWDELKITNFKCAFGSAGLRNFV